MKVSHFTLNCVGFCRNAANAKPPRYLITKYLNSPPVYMYVCMYIVCAFAGSLRVYHQSKANLICCCYAKSWLIVLPSVK